MPMPDQCDFATLRWGDHGPWGGDLAALSHARLSAEAGKPGLTKPVSAIAVFAQAAGSGSASRSDGAELESCGD